MESPLRHHNCKSWFKEESGWRWRLNEVRTIYIILSIFSQITIIVHLQIIHKFHICEFSCSLKFTGNPKFNTHGIFCHYSWIYKKGEKKWSCSMCTCSAEVEQGNTLPSYFSCHSVNQSVFQGVLSGFCIFVLFIGYSIIYWEEREHKSSKILQIGESGQRELFVQFLQLFLVQNDFKIHSFWKEDKEAQEGVLPEESREKEVVRSVKCYRSEWGWGFRLDLAAGSC